MWKPRIGGKHSRFMGCLNHYRHCNSFADAEQLYESIKPIAGQHLHLDIRPLSGRSRKDMRIVKRDGEYNLTDNWWTIAKDINHYCWAKANNGATYDPALVLRCERFISFTSDDVITIYHPAEVNGTNGQNTLVCKDFAIGHFCFLDRFLPSGMSAVRHDGKVYIQLEPHGKKGFRQYLIPRTLEGLRFKRVRGDWKCLNPVQEIKKLIDRKAVNLWLKEKSENYIADINAFYPWVDDTQINNAKLPTRNVTLQMLRESIDTSPHSVAVLLKCTHRYGTYDQTLKRLKKLDEQENVVSVIRGCAAYFGNCFTVEKVPIGVACNNSRYDLRPAQVELI